MHLGNRKNVYRMGKGWILIKNAAGTTYREWFSDKKNGGCKRALKYAEDTRDLIEAFEGPTIPAMKKTR